jgi:hypothetical protein
MDFTINVDVGGPQLERAAASLEALVATMQEVRDALAQANDQVGQGIATLTAEVHDAASQLSALVDQLTASQPSDADVSGIKAAAQEQIDRLQSLGTMVHELAADPSTSIPQNPAPIDGNPTPATPEPTPSEPAPTEPVAPTEPGLTPGPVPGSPDPNAPTEPTPGTEPAPTEPAPTEPTPEPAPTEPTPTEPAPEPTPEPAPVENPPAEDV